jgi:leader peptidase (prepilin peptidase)/N-methyltransferase
MIILFLAILGLCLGSFVNALVWRLHEQEKLLEKKRPDANKLAKLSISKGRSMCPRCNHVLTPADLVPVLSWLYLRGKCRYCRAVIEDTPVPEVVGMGVFVLSYAVWPYGFDPIGVILFVVWLASLVLMLALAVYDARWYILPTKLIIWLGGLAGIFAVLGLMQEGVTLGSLGGVIAAVLLLWGLFRSIYAVSPKLIGFGDVRLAIPLALFAGSPWAVCILLFVASFIGTVAALPLLITGKATLKYMLPFGPFLLVGCFVAVLFGDAVLQWLDETLFYVGVVLR